MMKKKLRLLSLLFLSVFITACGLGLPEDECKDPHPSQADRCEAGEIPDSSSEWDNMIWDKDNWG